jgi:acetyl-CoA synthetase
LQPDHGLPVRLIIPGYIGGRMIKWLAQIDVIEHETLGIVKAGCVVVSIADSFSATEIAKRCQSANATVCFTQDVIYRGKNKAIPLLERVLQADALRRSSSIDDGKECKSDDEAAFCNNNKNRTMKTVVLPAALHTGRYNETNITAAEDDYRNKLHETAQLLLRPGLDWTWTDFLDGAATCFDSVIHSSMDACNILFSSGTTGEPKAIVWTHTHQMCRGRVLPSRFAAAR